MSRLQNNKAGFTLVELLIGVSLALMVMTAVLTSYVTLGRNFTRSLGISSANQPTLEAQARRTLAVFTQDVRMSSGVTAPASPDTLTNALKLTQPLGNGTTVALYYYNLNADSRYLHSNDVIDNIATSADVEFKSYTLTRVNMTTRAYQVLHASLLSCTFNYYDSSGNPYASFTNYLPGIKQVSLALTSQAGSSTNGTLTQVYRTDSPRLILRNKPFLP